MVNNKVTIIGTLPVEREFEAGQIVKFTCRREPDRLAIIAAVGGEYTAIGLNGGNFWAPLSPTPKAAIDYVVRVGYQATIIDAPITITPTTV